jgi:hypothetical protein
MEDVLLLMLRINLVEEDWLTIPMHPQVTQSISSFFFVLLIQINFSQILFSLSLIVASLPQEPLLLDILEGQRKSIAQNSQLIKVLVAVNKPHASSNTSLRVHHQVRFKTEMRSYYQCEDPHNPSVTKCMLLNTFLPTNKVIAAHIIAVKNRNTLAMLDLHAEDLWSCRNGLLLFEPIEKRFNNLEVVCLIISQVLLISHSFSTDILARPRHSNI